MHRTLGKAITLLLALTVSFGAYSRSGNYEKAVEAFQKDKVEEAYIHIKNELKENPQYLPALILLAEILIEQRKFDLAERELGRAIRLGVDNDIVVQLLGEVLLAQSEFSEALTYAERFTLSQTGSLNYQLIRAKAYRALEKPAEAEEIYQQLLFRHPANLEARLGLVVIHLSKKDYVQAQELLNQVKAESAQSSDYWILTGRLHSANGKLEQAIEAYKQAVAVSPESIPALKALAVAYHVELKDFKKAEQTVDKVLELSPNDPHAKLIKSNVLASLDENKLADQILLELHNQLSTIDAQYLVKSSLLQFIDAVTSYKLDKWEEASRKFELYLSKERDVNAALLLADSYIQLDEHFSALELLESYRAELKSNRDQALILVSLYQHFTKSFDASDYLLDLKELYPGDTHVLIFSARNYSQIGRHERALQELKGANDKELPEYLHALTVAQFNLNQLAEALATSDKLLVLDAANKEYLLLRAQIFMRLSRPNQAGKIISELYQENSEDQEIAYAFAHFLKDSGSPNEAKPIGLALTSKHPKNNQYWFLLADIEYKLGNTEQAIEILKGKVKGERIAAALELAQIYCEESMYSECIRATESVLFNDRLNERALNIKAKAHIAQKERAEAGRVLNTLANLWSEQPLKLLGVSKLQVANENFKEAEENLTKAIELDPEIPPLYFELVRLKIKRNLLGEAKPLLAEYEKRVGANPYASILKGDLALAEKQPEQAFKHYQTALTRDADNGVAFMKLTQLGLNSGLASEYFALAEKMLSEYPQKHFIRHTLADSYLRQGMLEKAQFHLQTLLTKKLPTLQRARALNNLAYLHIKQKRFELAQQLSEQALAYFPQSPNFLDTHGWALTLNEQYSKGLGFLREAYVRDSSNLEIRFHLAYALVKLGRQQESRQMLKGLPDFPEGIEEQEYALELIKALG